MDRLERPLGSEAGAVVLLFDDYSRMKIKTAAPKAVSPGGKIKSVQEAETELKIEFEDGSTGTDRDLAHCRR